MKYRAYLMVGPPGSGKGTQGRALSNVASVFHCSCGEVFRALDGASEIGRLFMEYSHKGMLVPDDVTVQVWLAHIKRCESEKKFCSQSSLLLLDGIPRNTIQARLMAAAVEIVGVLHFDGLSRSELLVRLRKRAAKEGRADDSQEEVISRRIDLYERESNNLLAIFPRHRIYKIEANHQPQRVLSQLVGVIAGNSRIREG